MRYGGSNPPLCTSFEERQWTVVNRQVEASSVLTMSESQKSLNPAADKGRMAVALGALVVLGLLSWVTIDGSAVLHVAGRSVPVRWFPELILGLFAFRTVMAHTRARLETKGPKEG